MNLTFSAEYDETNQRDYILEIGWRSATIHVKNKLSEYPAPAQIQREYDWELKVWIDNGWLLPYPEDELRPPKGLIAFMAVLQENRQVWPVMNYHKLKEHVDAYTASADIYTQKLREWQH